LQEGREARDLIQLLGATLARIRIATVTLVYSSHALPKNPLHPRNARTQYALLGRMTHNAERTRIIIRLIDVAADRHIWGDSFGGSVNDPFELQDQVVDGVLCGVVSRIADSEIERVCDKDPRDHAARGLALRAWPLVLGASVPKALKAIPILEHAVELDPSDALAAALLACCHTHLSNYHGTLAPTAARDIALSLAGRAGLLDSDDPLVMTARAMAMSPCLEPEEGHWLATRALAIDPTSAWAWERSGFARLRRNENPDRTIGDFARALKLRGSAWHRSNCFFGIACAHRAAGRLQEVFVWTRKAIAENPDGAWLYRELARTACAMGDRSGAAHAVDR